MSTRFLKLAGLIAAIALVAAACSSSNGSAAPEDELEPGPPDTTEQAASSGSVFYAMGDDDTRQWSVAAELNEKGGLPFDPGEPATPENQAVYNDALTTMDVYLAFAWIAPFDVGESDWDRLGEWVQILDDSADAKWGLGPTYMGTSVTDSSVPAADLRVAQWLGGPGDISAEERRIPPPSSYDYLLTSLVTSIPFEDGNLDVDRMPRVLIERSANGALEAVYVEWATEFGFTSAANGLPLVSLNNGIAKLVPNEGDEGDLRIVTLATENHHPIFGGNREIVTQNIGYSKDTPRMIFPDRIQYQVEE